MAVRHINQNAKEESGILLSGEDAKKVFSMFRQDRKPEDIEKKKQSLQSLFDSALKTAISR